MRRLAGLTLRVVGILAVVVLLVTGGVVSSAKAADITIGGKVFIDSSAPAPGAVTVFLDKWDGTTWQQVPGSSETDSQGAYSFVVTELGQYRARAIAADSVTIPSGATSGRSASYPGTWTLNDLYLRTTSLVSGFVSLGETRAGAGEVTVEFNHPGCCDVTTVTTGADGSFQARVPSGLYSIRFVATSDDFAPEEVEVSVPGGGTAVPVPEVFLSRYPTISGHVQNVAGQSLPGITVTVTGYNDFGAAISTFTATTDSAGDYEVIMTYSSLSWWEVLFSDESGRYATMGWENGNPVERDIDPIEVTSGAIEGIDAVLPLAGVIRGSVEGMGLIPDAYSLVGIELFGFVEEYGAYTYYTSVRASETGTYAFEGLAPDTYRINVRYRYPDGQAIEIYGGDIVVTPGGTITQDFSLGATRPRAGELIKFADSQSPIVYLSDGAGGLIALPSFDVVRDFGLSTAVRTVNSSTIAIKSIYGPLSHAVTCGTEFSPSRVRLGAGGVGLFVDESTIDGLEYTALPPELCAVLPVTHTQVFPILVRSTSSPTIWLIDRGERKRVPDAAVLGAIAAPTGGAPQVVRQVSPSFVSAFPEGSAAIPAGRLVRTSDSSRVYLSDGEGLVPLSNFGAISDGGFPAGILTYAPGSFAGLTIRSTQLGHVVRCWNNGQHYVAAQGRLNPVTEDAVDGLSVTGLSSDACRFIPRSPGPAARALFVKSPSSSTVFFVDGGIKRPVLTMSTVSRLSAPGPASFFTVDNSFLASLPTGSPVLEPGMLVRAGVQTYLVDGAGEGLLPITGALSQSGLPREIVMVPASVLTGIPVEAPLSSVISCLGRTWVAGSGRLWPVLPGLVAGAPVSSLTDATCLRFPRSTAATASRLFVKSTSPAIYEVVGGTRHAALTMASVAPFTPSGFPTFLTVDADFLASMAEGLPLLDPGMLVKGSGSTVFVVDGETSPVLRPVPSLAILADFGISAPVIRVSDSLISGLPRGAALTNAVTCLSSSWIAASGALRPVQPGVIAGLPASTLDDSTCSVLRRSTVSPGVRLFLRQSNGAIFSLEGGRKLPVISMATIDRLAPRGAPAYVGVGEAFLASIPTGPALLDAGMLVKGTGPAVYLVDGLGGKVPVSSFAMVADLGLPTAFQTVPDDVVAGLTTKPPLSNFLDCGGVARLAASGRLWAMNVADRGSLVATSVPSTLCNVLPAGTFSLTGALLVKSPESNAVYRIVNGQRVAVDGATFAALGGRFVTVNRLFLTSIPLS